MKKILGVIPAAGGSTRWGEKGMFNKEFLTVHNTTLLDRTVETMIMGGASEVLIIVNEEKLVHYMERFHGRDDIAIDLQTDQETADMWGAMKLSFHYAADRYLFAMPDTYFPLEVFQRNVQSEFLIGTHVTNYPERFGVRIKNRWVNKKEGLDPDDSYFAWGTLIWSHKVVELWKEKRPRDYTAAINLACKEFGYAEFYMDYYYDMATPTHYAEFLQERGAATP